MPVKLISFTDIELEEMKRYAVSEKRNFSEFIRVLFQAWKDKKENSSEDILAILKLIQDDDLPSSVRKIYRWKTHGKKYLCDVLYTMSTEEEIAINGKSDTTT